MASSECTNYADPNDYIDDPNTLENGLFECGDPNLTLYNFTPPTFWKRQPHPKSGIYDILPPKQIDSYAGLHSSFDPNGVNWNIPVPYEGNFFVLLSSGGFSKVSDGTTIEDGDIKGSSISQKVHLSAGDLIMGAYFFGTFDYPQFNDYGRIYAELDPNYICPFTDPNDPNECPAEEFTIIYKKVGGEPNDIGSYGSTEGWIEFEHIVEPNQAGPYWIHCEVVDHKDTIYNSYLGIDSLRICRGGRSEADLNRDCDVNLLDYSVISEAWMSFCPDIYDPNTMDPNDFADPNIPCQLADLDNSWYVDPNDLVILSDQWLF